MIKFYFDIINYLQTYLSELNITDEEELHTLFCPGQNSQSKQIRFNLTLENLNIQIHFKLAL